MLPQSHITYTVATADFLKDRLPALRKVDYRLLALMAIGPDLIDKPLATLYFYRRYKSAVLFAHTLLVHMGIFLYVIWRKPKWWPYALAFNGHAILDRLWLFHDTWYWPFRGWRFHVWRKEGSEQQEGEEIPFRDRPRALKAHARRLGRAVSVPDKRGMETVVTDRDEVPVIELVAGPEVELILLEHELGADAG